MNANGNETSQDTTALEALDSSLGGSDATLDANVHATAHLDADGHLVFDVKDETELKGKVDKHIVSLVTKFIEERDAKRQKIEDERANKRNFNRMMTLLGALIIGLVIVWTLPQLGSVGKLLSPYAFCITILLDSAITVWAYIKRY